MMEISLQQIEGCYYLRIAHAKGREDYEAGSVPDNRWLLQIRSVNLELVKAVLAAYVNHTSIIEHQKTYVINTSKF